MLIRWITRGWKSSCLDRISTYTGNAWRCRSTHSMYHVGSISTPSFHEPAIPFIGIINLLWSSTLQYTRCQNSEYIHCSPRQQPEIIVHLLYDKHISLIPLVFITRNYHARTSNIVFQNCLWKFVRRSLLSFRN